ncbi:B-cell antigen receptor complex-associated protein alpha chain [Hippoglossus stenolepis]|uniref:B-cell antigen receptor complex-associated protein alpha chain n=1 Tax=Hippoglossus stenolepis TaxID=195615 RepID=UPI00159C12F4|nr:B-cell antigen receptor complex-associated protein alpha chain [Hippoglossus stenolepis]
MGIATIFVLCSFAVGVTPSAVTLEADIPFLKLPLSKNASLECCYTARGGPQKLAWVKSFRCVNVTIGPCTVTLSGHVSGVRHKSDRKHCGTLTMTSVQLNDTGLYQCWLYNSKVYSHGTYLHVYEPLEKKLNLSESTKNKILTVEGVLLFLCVLLPSAALFCKSKKLHELEKKKAQREEENIYQGLNLDDCCDQYDQIERSQARGPYEDVCNIMEEEEEIQLEKP